MASYTLNVPGKPIAQPRQRHTKSGRNYVPQSHAVHGYKSMIRVIAREVGVRPCVGAVEIDVTFFIKRPRSVRSKYCDKRPDIDNYLKAVFDALNEVAYQDDGQIVSVHAAKQYVVMNPATVIQIKEIEDA